MYCLKIDLLCNVSCPLATVKLNFVSVPGFQMTDAGSTSGFIIPTIPDHPHEISKFIQELLRTATCTFLKFGDFKSNLRPIVVLGTSSKKELFPPATSQDENGNYYAPQDPSRFKETTLYELNAEFPASEIALLKDVIKTKVFKDAGFHFFLQTQVRHA